jgi:glycosyltransferase involved in cell wall biosynthesis
LPVYNAAPTLRRALLSLFAQTHRDWECVLVDDGSSDASLQIARRLAASEPRVRVSEQPHGGIVHALNHGLSLCRGAQIARFDADDLMHPTRLARQVAALEANPDLLAVGCQVQLFPRRGLTPGRLAYQTWLNSLTTAAEIFRDRFVECPVAHPALLLRAPTLLALGYRDTGWAEDYDLLLRLLAAGPCVGTVAAPLLAWRDGPRRLSRTHERYALDSFFRCKAQFLAEQWLAQHSHYVLWGYGDTGRMLCRALTALGKRPSQILELHPRRQGQIIEGARVFPPDAVRELGPNRNPILASVAGGTARAELRSRAHALGLVEGQDYVVCA